jgi:hypothetical protein
MAKLTCRNFASRWEREQISKYPEIKLFINKLKNMIENHPEKGLPDSFISAKGKTVPCFKRSINLSLFPPQYALGYNFITAQYIFDDKIIYIFNLYFSI